VKGSVAEVFLCAGCVAQLMYDKTLIQMPTLDSITGELSIGTSLLHVPPDSCLMGIALMLVLRRQYHCCLSISVFIFHLVYYSIPKDLCFTCVFCYFFLYLFLFV